MLRINVIGSTGQAKSYFSDHLVKDLVKEDYFLKDNEHVSALWRGQAAEKMQLSGEVRQEDYLALVDHKNPTTNEPLTSRTKENRRVGYDFTFSAPKSVSVLYAHTNDSRVLDAFRDSVQETMKEIEAEVQVRVRQDGEVDGRRVTGNALWAGFLHHETRPVDGKPDPHMHEHVVLQNVTWDSEYKNKDGSKGAWMAADVSDIKRNAPYYQAAFDARLAGKLQEMGYAVRQTEKSFDLAGFSNEIKQTFSRRTALIEKKAAELGIERIDDKSELGAKTREAKLENLTHAEMLSEWNSRLSDREWNAFLSQAESGGSVAQLAPDEAVEYGLNHTLERQSVARRSDVLAHALQRGVSLSPAEVQQALNRREDLIYAGDRGQVQVTTQKVLEEEQAMIRFARDGRGTCHPLGSSEFEFRPIVRADGDSFDLNEQQQAAVRHVLTARSQVVIIRGSAGTGKTSMVSEAIRGIEENGGQVHSFAPTSSARDVLKQDGDESGVSSLQNANTVAKLLQDKELQAELRGQTILIDEAGLVSTPEMKKVFDLAEQQQARVILSGDYKQHSSVQRGDSLRVLVEQAGIRPAEITEIQRQRNQVFRDAVEDLSRGTRAGVTQGFDALDAMGLVEEIQDRDERNGRLAAGYVEAVKAGKSSIVVSPTHAEGNEVSEQIRSRLKAEGIVGQKDHAVKRLRNLQFTEEQKSNPFVYEAGQVVEFHQRSKVVPSSTFEVETVLGMGPHGATIHKQFEENSRTTKVGYNWKGETGLQREAPVKKGLTYGARATVLGRDQQGQVHVRTDAGDVVQLPLSEANKFSVYEETSVNLADGDSIRITQNICSKPKSKRDKKHRLSNGAIYRVDGFTQNGDIRLENGWLLDRQEAAHLTAGYVTTSHASQGKTRDIVFVSQSSESFAASNQAQFYVSVSRSKEATYIFSDDKKALRNQAILRSAERMAATELSAKAAEQQQTEVAEHERQQRQQTFFSRMKDAGRRAREVARRKAEQVKASVDRLRDQWKTRSEGVSHEH